MMVGVDDRRQGGQVVDDRDFEYAAVRRVWRWEWMDDRGTERKEWSERNEKEVCEWLILVKISVEAVEV